MDLLFLTLSGGRQYTLIHDFVEIECLMRTRKHSSRMRTVRCSSHLLGCGGVVCLARGVPAKGGVYTSPCGQIDTCENITFPQLLLRMVTIDCVHLHEIATYSSGLVHVLKTYNLPDCKTSLLVGNIKQVKFTLTIAHPVPWMYKWRVRMPMFYRTLVIFLDL